MLVTLDGFSALLRALNLSQGFSKPIPFYQVFDNGASSGSALTLVSPDNIPGRQVGVAPTFAPAVARATDADMCYSQAYDSTVAEQSFPLFVQDRADIYRYRQQKSVNMGSWFVQEAWMVPSLFKCASGRKVSELDVASGWNSITAARALLERHWDTFITKKDFDYLANIGINTVRLPIGYWTLGPEFCLGTPFSGVADVYRNSWNHLVRAINMAGQAGIGVLIDLHGAVGSQNGQPHSGISDGSINLFNNSDNIRMTVNVLKFLVENFASVTNVVGIQLLNEPKNVPALPSFYNHTIDELRQLSPAAAELPLYVHDGFDLDRFGDFMTNRTDFVVQDHHSYFVFTASDASEPADQHTNDVETNVATSLKEASLRQHRNLVVDEWSCALTPSSLAGESNPGESRTKFCNAQMDIYSQTTAGWGFWSYKKEDCDGDPGWCFLAAVGNTLPSSFFSYGQAPMTDPLKRQDAMARISKISIPSPTEIASKAPRSYLVGRGHFAHSHRPATHQRRQAQFASSDGPHPNEVQESFVKGYMHGFSTAKTFALNGLSRLGFVGQYIVDSLANLGPDVIKPGTEKNYTDGFESGLKDGETVIASALNIG